MHSKAKLPSYEQLELSITTTASVEDWRALLKQLQALKDGDWYAWPVSGLISCIEQLLSDLDKTHLAYTEPKKVD